MKLVITCIVAGAAALLLGHPWATVALFGLAVVTRVCARNGWVE